MGLLTLRSEGSGPDVSDVHAGCAAGSASSPELRSCSWARLRFYYIPGFFCFPVLSRAAGRFVAEIPTQVTERD